MENYDPMNNISVETALQDLRYLQLLSKQFPTISDACTEIINLEAILNLPKGTEHFLTDIHGEYEAFQHVLKNASGTVRRKVDEIFGQTLRESEKKELCTLIYYPDHKLELIKSHEPDMEDWYKITLHQLIRVCQNVSSKYTRSKVRKALPTEFSYILQELLHESQIDPNKQAYVNASDDDVIIIKSPVGMPGRAIKNAFIERMLTAPDKISHCFNCLKACNPVTAPYCITQALINAVVGDLDNGLIFCGSRVGEITKITTVPKLMQELTV